jgi:hypothetical protein
MFHSFIRSLTFPAPFSAFSTQGDRLPALFVVGSGANLRIFLRRSLRLARSHTIKRLVAYRHYNKDQKCK